MHIKCRCFTEWQHLAPVYYLQILSTQELFQLFHPKSIHFIHVWTGISFTQAPIHHELLGSLWIPFMLYRLGIENKFLPDAHFVDQMHLTL